MQMSRCVKSILQPCDIKQRSLITQDVDHLFLAGDGSNFVRLQWLCVLLRLCTETVVFSQRWDPAGSKDSAEPHDSCSQRQFSTSFIHHMDTEPMLHTEYHMTCMWVRACMCFSYCSRRLAYLWIIIPLWNVTFQTQWPRADHWTGCGDSVCPRMCVWQREKTRESQTILVL